MSPLVGLERHSVLRHQHEYRQEDRFERDHEREKAERIGVEWLEAKKRAGLTHQTSREPPQMDGRKGNASRPVSDCIAETVGKRSPIQRSPFDIRDSANVRLKRMVRDRPSARMRKIARVPGAFVRSVAHTTVRRPDTSPATNRTSAITSKT